MNVCPQQSHSICPVTLFAHRGCPFPSMRFCGRMKRGNKLELSVVTAARPRGCCIIPRQGGEKTAMNWEFTNQNLQLCAPNPVIVSATLQKRPKPTKRNATRDFFFFFYTEDSVQLPPCPLPLRLPDKYPATMEESANSLGR